MKKNFTCSILAASMLAAFGAQAETYFFSVEGAGEMDGSSWENAAPGEYLGGTIAGAEIGDVICIQAGVYPPDHDLGLWQIPQGITIKGGYPATMSGTDTAITYPTEAQTVWSADLDGDGNGDNGEQPFVQLNNGDKYKDQWERNVIAGITIRDAYNQSTSSYRGSAMQGRHVSVELDHVYFLNNKCAGSGGVVAFYGSDVYAHDCVWRDNQSKSVGVAAIFRQYNSSSAEGYNEREKCVAIVDRCEFTNNTVYTPDDSGVAKYGGALAVADYGGTLYMNNCFVTGSHISWAGAMARMGTATTLYSTNNTWFDLTCSYDVRHSGSILSVGTRSNLYIANTIAVNYEDGFDGMLASMFIQESTCTFVSGGYNLWGSLYNTTTSPVADTDNISKDNLIPTAFGTNKYYMNDDRNVIEPLESWRGVPTAEIAKLAEAWQLPAEIDLTKDQMGKVRPETTVPGAFDVKATDPSGIESVTVSSNAIRALGGNMYKAEAGAQVYDLQGRMVGKADAEGIVSLQQAERGMYIIRSGASTAKVIK